MFCSPSAVLCSIFGPRLNFGPVLSFGSCAQFSGLCSILGLVFPCLGLCLFEFQEIEFIFKTISFIRKNLNLLIILSLQILQTFGSLILGNVLLDDFINIVHTCDLIKLSETFLIVINLFFYVILLNLSIGVL